MLDKNKIVSAHGETWYYTQKISDQLYLAVKVINFVNKVPIVSFPAVTYLLNVEDIQFNIVERAKKS